MQQSGTRGGAAGHEIYKPRQINYRLEWERETTGEALLPAREHPREAFASRGRARSAAFGSMAIDPWRRELQPWILSWEGPLPGWSSSNALVLREATPLDTPLARRAGVAGDAAEKRRCTSETFALARLMTFQKTVPSEKHLLSEDMPCTWRLREERRPPRTMHLGRHFGGGKNRAHLAGVGLAAVENGRGKLAVTRGDRTSLRAARPKHRVARPINAARRGGQCCVDRISKLPHQVVQK